ncbi:hypothetical protein VHEMI00339 [[Torrubiella] hemipterigena]|uniref:Major facilitator superfamily (MFS) profile domain-containing protein n=1 Tax=[Torrubiella] hemipterigena TaxID=1531966 RepID=A0A0A1T4B1_9HYPO|nr:hypothetical protein VHEMI00339 [[Torrubiella] hemipterigena]
MGSDMVTAEPQPRPSSSSHHDKPEEPLGRIVSTAPYSSFNSWQKKLIVLASAITAFFSPLSAQIYLPALSPVAEDLGVDSTHINLTITTYMVFQGITPMFIGSLADVAGRRPAYFICFVIYIAANIGLALAPNYGAVLALRCLQSAGSSSTVALCMAVIADVITSAERGQYIGYTSLPIILAPSLGPVIGGLLAQYLGWRSIFWFLAIFAAVTIILIMVFLPETCRHIVGDGSKPCPVIYWSGYRLMRQMSKSKAKGTSDTESQTGVVEKKSTFKGFNILGSLMLLLQKETAVLLWTSSIVFAGFYSVSAATPTLVKQAYGFNETQVGLMYLPMAGGSILAAFVLGPFMNRRYKAHCIKLGIPFDKKSQIDMANFPIERVRLEVGLPLLILATATMVGWGWALDKAAHVAVVCVVNVFMSFGLVGFSNTISTLVVELHPGKAGTATAASNFTRCLVGAGASAAIAPMMNAWGGGFAFTFYAGLYGLCCIPMVYLMYGGLRWRQKADASATTSG